nr:MAG TPA: hypothetical protein [Caudoviricetes sp.]
MKKAAHGAAFLYCLRKGGGAYALLNIRPKEVPAAPLGGLFCPFKSHLRTYFIRGGLHYV